LQVRREAPRDEAPDLCVAAPRRGCVTSHDPLWIMVRRAKSSPRHA